MIASFDRYQNVMLTKYKEDGRGLPVMISENYRMADLVLIETAIENVYEVLKDRYGNNLGDHLNFSQHSLAKLLLGSKI